MSAPEYRFDVVPGNGKTWLIRDNELGGWVNSKRGAPRRFSIESNAITAAVRLEFAHKRGEV